MDINDMKELNGIFLKMIEEEVTRHARKVPGLVQAGVKHEVEEEMRKTRKVITCMVEAEVQRAVTERMEPIKLAPGNRHGSPWTMKEEHLLRDAVVNTIAKVARESGRTGRAIACRIRDKVLEEFCDEY